MIVAELGRGIKAGILAGLVYGILYALYGLIFFQIFASQLGFYSYDAAVNYYVAHALFADIIIGIIWGLILGLIYAFTYNRLPGRKIGKSARAQWTVSETKGAVLALIVWVIIFLISIPTQLQTSLFLSEIEGALTLQILVTAVSFLLFVLMLGYQLGWFWDRFKPKTPQPVVIPPPP
jgi:predicted histidine transporter YuiF (NhaC family)